MGSFGAIQLCFSCCLSTRSPVFSVCSRQSRGIAPAMRNSQIRAIFFDFGGVLLKTFDGVDHEAIEARFGLEAKMLRKCVYRESRYMDFQVGKCTYDEWTHSIRGALTPHVGERADEVVNA